MDYGMIGKIEKAKRYAEERTRIHFESFRATFDGENNPHGVEYRGGVRKCDCDFFLSRAVCSHSMAAARSLEGRARRQSDCLWLVPGVGVDLVCVLVRWWLVRSRLRRIKPVPSTRLFPVM